MRGTVSHSVHAFRKVHVFKFDRGRSSVRDSVSGQSRQDEARTLLDYVCSKISVRSKDVAGSHSRCLSSFYLDVQGLGVRSEDVVDSHSRRRCPSPQGGRTGESVTCRGWLICSTKNRHIKNCAKQNAMCVTHAIGARCMHTFTDHRLLCVAHAWIERD